MSEVTASIDIADHEFPSIEEVCRRINEKVGSHRDAEGLVQEIKGRFADIGLVVNVDAYVPANEMCRGCGGTGRLTKGRVTVDCVGCGGSGHFASGEPEFVELSIAIVGRTERKEFDHERQAHDVQHDTLGLGTGGLISEKGRKDLS